VHADPGAVGSAARRRRSEAERRLAEGEPFEPVLELLGEVATGAVLCSHGDIVPAVIQALARRGMEVETRPDWRKGTIWVLKRKGDRITKGKVWPPPC
jgi:8-oxo-dGTP diphosphatase